MIISHSQKFIFVKPRKVAGTTIELMLSKYLQNGDCATPIEPQEEYLRSCRPGVTIGKIAGQKKIGLQSRLRDHSSLKKAYSILGKEVRNYFIITACRNPWDRAVSQFFWSLRKRNITQKDFKYQKKEFNKFTQFYGPKNWLNLFYGRKKQRSLNSSHLYSLNGKIMANFVIRFEHLEKDFSKLKKHLSLTEKDSVNQFSTKSTFRPHESRVWQNFYDNDTRDLIKKCCSDEIHYFNYNFEGINYSKKQESKLPFLKY